MHVDDGAGWRGDGDLNPIERSDIYLYARARLDTTIVQILYMLEPTQSKCPGLASGCRTDPECRDGVTSVLLRHCGMDFWHENHCRILLWVHYAPEELP
jgi:hypothetical protein